MKLSLALLLFIVVSIGWFLYFPSNQNQVNKSNNIYVATDGNDENPGTKTKPFRSLAKAAAEATPGTTVLIREGTYKEVLIVQHSGSEAEPIHFRPYKAEQVILSGQNIANEAGDTALITIEDKNHVTVSGLTIQDLTTILNDETVMGIYVTGNSNDVVLNNNHIQRVETHADEGNAHGIAVYGTGAIRDITISNNTVEDLKLGTSESIVLNGNVEDFQVEGNLVRRNNNIGIDVIGYEGVATDQSVDYARNGLIKDNVVYQISSYSNPAYGEEYVAAGIYVDGGTDIVIDNNRVYENDIGIEATSEHAAKFAENIEITNNTIYNNYYTGIAIGGYDEERGGTKNSSISHNIIYRNDTKELGGGQLLIQHDVRDNIIEKNILTAGPTRIFVANYFQTVMNNKWSRNVFHYEPEKEGIWTWKDNDYTSFQAFQKVTNNDEKSKYINVVFRDEKAFDFELVKDSPTYDIVK
ncbi:hypothetical protein Pryu01_02000 [Paraliobacillus ryukyuensis]|uniref:Parallel beta-helix repeat protein n=1 Tax=Paraliobacillus ryukyuensis TaxID=200904 RepID=A0A366DZ02_9BACI|nr:right-handed parallel beta-helix repeat-containing protein [Paraliobacillus ryukyuensis]RBO95267.1 parallel beta-helix repeat protein [Paraliobacillus ryukyuensis]